MTQYLTVEKPIVSKHAGDPEMAEFIRDFIASLPTRTQELQRCVQARDAEELSRLAGQLRVTASDQGGVGFGDLSAAADRLARLLRGSIDWTSVERAMAVLSNLSHRVKATEDCPNSPTAR